MALLKFNFEVLKACPNEALHKVGRITRLNNDEVRLICYENGLELDLGTSEWPNLLFYSCCKLMFWMH